MRILQLSNTYLPHVGGVARSVSSFTREYLRLGHEVLVVAPDIGKCADPADEAVVERIPAIPNFNDSEFAVRLPLTNLSDRMRSFQADVIHAHHPFLFGETALREAAARNVPVVLTYHTMYEDYVYTLPLIGKKVAARTIAMAFAATFANRCDGVIVPSERVRRTLVARGVSAPMAVIPTGIDVDGIAAADPTAFRERNGIPRDRFVIGHVGRLAPEKNLRYLAESVALFMRDEGDERSLFLVVGGGPEKAAIEEAFEREGISDRLFFAGKLTGASLYESYKAMDVFAFASKSETQGLVVAEAMAAGIPVVALDASGVTDALAGGGRRLCSRTLLKADASPGDFALCILRLQSLPPLKAKIGEDCAARAREAFRREVCAKAALDFYETIRKGTRMRRLLTGGRRYRRFLRWLRNLLYLLWQIWTVARIAWTDLRQRRRSARSRS